MWDFEQLRDYIFKHLDETITDPLERIQVADALEFEQWVIPAMAQLCKREAPLSAMEGASLGFHRFAEVCRLREHPRKRYEVSKYEEWLKKPGVKKGW